MKPFIIFCACLCACAENDDKYRYEPNGLRIFHINASDNGTYECRAEMLQRGDYRVRDVQLEVLCK